MSDEIAEDPPPQFNREAGNPDGSISRRSVLLTGTAVAAASLAPASLARAAEAHSATTATTAELDRTILPVSSPDFAGKIGDNYKDSVPDWNPVLPIQVPKGAPNILLI